MLGEVRDAMTKTAKPKEWPKEAMVEKYGFEWNPISYGGQWVKAPDWYIEYRCLTKTKKPWGYKGFEFHFKRYVEAMLGDPNGLFGFEWNPNAERILTAFINNKFVSIIAGQ